MTTADLMAAPAIPLGPATSASRLADLAATGGPAVRLRVAQHANTDIDTLLRLADDEERTVREHAVRRLAA
ncbi:MAG: hypothetical protein IPK37_05645 [Austwickia sp.]|jgi:hypothetical protein|nr:MAG: hypothetical protein IPK37_05645 [Austwickia sp.]